MHVLHTSLYPQRAWWGMPQLPLVVLKLLLVSGRNHISSPAKSPSQVRGMAVFVSAIPSTSGIGRFASVPLFPDRISVVFPAPSGWSPPLLHWLYNKMFCCPLTLSPCCLLCSSHFLITNWKYIWGDTS